MGTSMKRSRAAWLVPSALAALAAVPFAVADCSSDNQSHANGSVDGSIGDGGPPTTDAPAADSTMSDGAAADAPDGAGDDGSSDANAEAEASCAFGDAGEAIDLRCGTLYADFDAKTVAAGVRKFDPGLRLWSDGAVKTRWIELPQAPDGGVMPIDVSNM